MNARDLVKEFQRQYLEKLDLPYEPYWKRDCSIMKHLVNTVGADKVEECLALYFEIPRKNYSVQLFKLCINELTRKIKPTRPKMINPDADRFI